MREQGDHVRENSGISIRELGMARQVSLPFLIGADLDIIKLSASLDSSLKKNTAFIKRLRTSLNADNQSALLKDISSLSLEKYIPEVVGAASEGLQKCKTIADIMAALEVFLYHPYSNPGYLHFTPTIWKSIYLSIDCKCRPCISSSKSSPSRDTNCRSTRKRGIITSSPTKSHSQGNDGIMASKHHPERE